ncbi:MAG TPA: hypothetical protein VJ847_12500 [Gemmatimonadales bacterium]|nr:hypothetical protein [Gemmatimonadales bacterium]
MTTGEVHLELLLGRLVRDSDGRPVGRIEEIEAERVDLLCLVKEFHLGPHALGERLAVPVLHAFGRARKPLRVPWDLLDFSDPAHPRLTCPRDRIR